MSVLGLGCPPQLWRQKRIEIMAIIRSNRKTNYTVIDNRVFADHRLSFAAMGLLGYLLSKPDNWTISTAQLVTVTEGTGKHTRRDGRDLA